MLRRQLTSSARRELTPQRATLQPTIRNREFATVLQAREWLTENGFRPRLGGGYERGPELAKIVVRGAIVIVEAINART